MNILVCSNISIPAAERTIPAWEYLRSLGHNVDVCHPKEVAYSPDVIICMGVTIMEEAFYAIQRFPHAVLYIFNWDIYAWVWTNPRKRTRTWGGEYDYHQFGELLKKAREIWVPSECTGKRTTQWYGLKNWHTILSSVPYWDHYDIQDKGYVYCALREIPDPKWSMLEQACKEMGLPLVMTKHELGYEEYKQKVAHCSFLVSHCYELSTGGLTLLEGYYHGKPCLLSNSEWHGGRDYMGERAQYFQWDDIEHLKMMLQMMWKERRDIRETLSDGREWIRDKFSDQVMVTKMLNRILHHANS